MPNVIVITGPRAAGKTTVASLLAEKLNVRHLSGDGIKDNLFPVLDLIINYPEKLAAVEAELLKQAKEEYDQGRSVIVDYIILGEYVYEYRNAFKADLLVQVFVPEVDEIVRRDVQRDCRTAGREYIDEQCTKFRRDAFFIGNEHFVDSTHESAEETAQRILASIF